MAGHGHAVYRAVARERGVRAEAALLQPARDEQVLERRERAARVGADGEREGRLQQPGRQADALALAGAVAAAVPGVEGQHERAAEYVRARDARADGGAGELYVPLRHGGEQPRDEHHRGALLYKMHERGLPRPGRGGEIAREHA